MLSIVQGKLRNLPAEFCAFWPKMKKIFKKIEVNLMENWLFHNFTKYLLDLWLLSESIYPWKITPDFYKNFSDFGGGAFQRPPPDATANIAKPWFLPNLCHNGWKLSKIYISLLLKINRILRIFPVGIKHFLAFASIRGRDLWFARSKCDFSMQRNTGC